MSEPAPPPDAVHVTWARFHHDTYVLARRLAAHGPFAGIVAIARGGLVPAAIVARELGVRLVDTVAIASYDDRVQGEARVLKAVAGDGVGWLVIDDLADTGATAVIVRAMLPKARFAAIYAKPAGRPMLDHFVAEVAQETWIVFPWDMPPPIGADEE